MSRPLATVAQDSPSSPQLSSLSPQLLSSSPQLLSLSPQRPGDVVASFAESSAVEVAEAAARAATAQRRWAALSPAERCAVLTAAALAVTAAADELAALIVREVGKPVTEASGEVGRAVAILNYYAQQVFDPIGSVHSASAVAQSGIQGLSYTRRRPRGVVGLVTPWNFPLAIPLWKAAPAWAFGNAVLLKPAPQATACALRMAELLEPILPPDLLTVLPGDAVTGAAVVAVTDAVSFTGSAQVGAVVAAAATSRGVPVQCEMGGQNPAVVLPDADIGIVCTQLAYAAFGFAGQKCTATKRVIVVDDDQGFAAALTAGFVSAAKAMTVGDPAEQATNIGPVIDESAASKVRSAIASAGAAGAHILCGDPQSTAELGTGGSEAAVSGAAEIQTEPLGWFVAPTIVANLPSGHELLCEEVFGPICAVQVVASNAEALHAANDVRYGLAAAIYTESLDAALGFAAGLDAGQIKINSPTTGVDFYLPFGGEGDSSVGAREQGKAAMDFYTSLHTISMMPTT